MFELGIEDVNRIDEDKYIVLMKVIFFFDKMYCMRYKIIKILLEYGVWVNIVDCDGWMVFMWVCIRG